MNADDIVYSDNGRHWRLVQNMGAGFWTKDVLETI